MRIEWTDKFSIGVKLFDEHHKYLIDIINDLLHALDKGPKEKERKIIKETLAKLDEYMNFHCQKEEEVLMESKYPFLEEHANSHNDLKNRMLDLSSRLKENSVTIPLVVALLKDWVVDHILKHDKRFGSYLNSKGIF